jgi:DNA polymerase-3 subunit gamma/tau
LSNLHLKYRPKLLKHLVGQPEAVDVLKGYLRNGGVPHVLMLTGPAGTGKTTIAYILASKVECSDRDRHEINAASSRGIDTIREIQREMNQSPWGGKTKVYILDEVANLSSDAQESLLVTLEKVPAHVYFFFATTRPEKLKESFRSRCAKIPLKPVPTDALRGLIKDVCDKEGKPVPPPAVIDKILEVANGCAREALQQLGAIINMDGEEQQLNAIQEQGAQKQAIDLCRLLMKRPKPKWKEIADLLKSITEEPETVRRAVLGYANSVLLNGENRLAFALVSCFQYDYFSSGKAGLTASCYTMFGEEK